jgi:hypothetical protein
MAVVIFFTSPADDEGRMVMLVFLVIDFPISLLGLPILRLLDLTTGYCYLTPEQGYLLSDVVYPSIVFLVMGGFQYLFYSFAGFKVYSYLLNRSKHARAKKQITYGVVTFFVLLFSWLIFNLTASTIGLFSVFIETSPEYLVWAVFLLTLLFIVICFRWRKKLLVLFWRSR